MMQKVADLLDRDRIGRTPIVPGQLGDRGHVRLDGAGGLSVQFEFADHLLTQGSHVGSSLGKRVETEIQRTPPVSSPHLLLTPPADKKSPAVPAEPSSPTVIHSLPRSGLVQQDFRTPVPPRKLLPSCSIR